MSTGIFLLSEGCRHKSIGVSSILILRSEAVQRQREGIKICQSQILIKRIGALGVVSHDVVEGPHDAIPLRGNFGRCKARNPPRSSRRGVLTVGKQIPPKPRRFELPTRRLSPRSSAIPRRQREKLLTAASCLPPKLGGFFLGARRRSFLVGYESRRNFMPHLVSPSRRVPRFSVSSRGSKVSLVNALVWPRARTPAFPTCHAFEER